MQCYSTEYIDYVCSCWLKIWLFTLCSLIVQIEGFLGDYTTFVLFKGFPWVHLGYLLIVVWKLSLKLNIILTEVTYKIINKFYSAIKCQSFWLNSRPLEIRWSFRINLSLSLVDGKRTGASSKQDSSWYNI